MNANRSSLSLSCHILMKLKCSRHIFEKYSNIKFQKIPSVGDTFFHADGRTDKTRLTVAFRTFANTPKKTIGINLINMHD